MVPLAKRMIGPSSFGMRILFVIVAVLSPDLSVFAQETWRRSYGGLGSDNAMSVEECESGGYIVAGTTGSFGNGSSDIYLIRLDEQGDLIWSRYFGGLGADIGVGCHESDGGYIVAGTVNDVATADYSMTLIKTDASGALMWQVSFGGSDWDICKGVVILPDGYLLHGISYDEQSPQGVGVAIRTDFEGTVLWEHRVVSAASSSLNDGLALPDGSVVLCGSMKTANGDEDGFLTRLNENGDEVWLTPYGGNEDDVFNSVAERIDGGFMACGSSRSVAAVQRIALCGFGGDGSYEWERFIGNETDASGADIDRAASDRFVFTGYAELAGGERDMIMTLVNEFGWFLNGNNFGNGSPADGSSVDATADGGFVAAGWIESIGPGPRAIYVVKADENCLTSSSSVESLFDPVSVQDFPPSGSQVTLTPNPLKSGGRLQIHGASRELQRFVIHDSSGRAIARSEQGWFSGTGIDMPADFEGLCHLTLYFRDGTASTHRLVVLSE